MTDTKGPRVVPLIDPAYKSDLSAGSCVGNLRFLNHPRVTRYVTCLDCPVRGRCPVPTRWPKDECCVRGHSIAERVGGKCTTCQDGGSRDA